MACWVSAGVVVPLSGEAEHCSAVRAYSPGLGACAVGASGLV